MDTHSEEQRLAELRASLPIPYPAYLTTEPLQHEIIELAAHLNAAQYRFLMLVAELDRSEGWAAHGVCSCAHWLSWRCGLGKRGRTCFPDELTRGALSACLRKTSASPFTQPAR